MRSGNIKHQLRASKDKNATTSTRKGKECTCTICWTVSCCLFQVYFVLRLICHEKTNPFVNEDRKTWLGHSKPNTVKYMRYWSHFAHLLSGCSLHLSSPLCCLSNLSEYLMLQLKYSLPADTQYEKNPDVIIFFCVVVKVPYCMRIDTQRSSWIRSKRSPANPVAHGWGKNTQTGITTVL